MTAIDPSGCSALNFFELFDVTRRIQIPYWGGILQKWADYTSVDHGLYRGWRIAIVQWVNHLRNNIFVNLPPLPLLCEISGAQPGLMAGRQAGRQADVIQVNFEIFKVGCRSTYLTYWFKV